MEMSKINLPKNFGEFPDDKKPAWKIEYDSGYAAGLRDGEKRERRVLIQLLKKDFFKYFVRTDMLTWLNTRAKKRNNKKN